MPYTYPLDRAETLDHITASLRRAVQEQDTVGADEFCEFYERFQKENPKFREEQPQLTGAYDVLFDQAHWLALPHLEDENDVIQLFETKINALKLLPPETSLRDLFRRRLLTVPLEERNAFKARVRDALLRDKEQITKPFAAFGSKLERGGTVANWVTEYLSMMRDAKNDALLQARFFNEHPTFRTLPADEQNILKELFATLEMTRTDSLKVDGYEGLKLVEVDGKLVEYDGGVFSDLGTEFQTLAEKLPAHYRTLSAQEKLRLRFADPPALAAALAAAMEQIRREAGSDPRKLRELVAQDLVNAQAKKKPPMERVAAALRLYASVFDFKTLLNERALNDAVRLFLEREKRTVDLDSFKVFPQAPQFLKLFLQVVFENMLGLPEGEAARQALQVANIARVRGDGTLMDVAFYDEDVDGFHWTVPLHKIAAAVS